MPNISFFFANFFFRLLNVPVCVCGGAAAARSNIRIFIDQGSDIIVFIYARAHTHNGGYVAKRPGHLFFFAVVVVVENMETQRERVAPPPAVPSSNMEKKKKKN